MRSAHDRRGRIMAWTLPTFGRQCFRLEWGTVARPFGRYLHLITKRLLSFIIFLSSLQFTPAGDGGCNVVAVEQVLSVGGLGDKYGV